MSWTPREQPKCPACLKAAYPAESIILLDRAPYHKRCIKCCNCDGRLTMGQIHENQGQLFCKNCYQTLFNPQYFQSLGYNGALSQDDRMRIMKERASRGGVNIGGGPTRQFNSAPGPQRNLFDAPDGAGANAGPQPFPFEPEETSKGPLFKPGVQVGLLTTIAPSNPITTSGL